MTNQNQSVSGEPQRPSYGAGTLSQDFIEKMMTDMKVRVEAVTKSFYLFFHFYFAHYVTFPTAKVQKEIFQLVEKSGKEDLFLVAFRGSGKSTIMTTVYPIWAILGEQQKKFIVIICQTRNQTRQHMANLKAELENNELLKNDLGPFEEESDEWGLYSMVFKESGARIIGASVEQGIRGIRHRQWRPDLIILDDVEDINSTKTYENREKLDIWFRGDIVPLGEPNHTRIVVVGNLLHEDSLMMRLKRQVEAGRSGVFRMFPLIDASGKVAWPGKYPTPETIEEERRRHGHIAFEREFNLRILPAEDQVVPFDWIRTYADLPQGSSPTKILIGVDLAISDKNTADNTAVITAALYGYGKDAKVYFLPHPINEKLSFPATLDRIRQLYREATGLCSLVEILVEDVAYQRAVIQTLEMEHLPVKGIRVTDDKRARLTIASRIIKNGQALFADKGNELQIQQITGFGVEGHDDLVDATTMILLEVLNTRSGVMVPKRLILGATIEGIPKEESRYVVGVDVGEKLTYVIGNRHGLLGYGVMDAYEADAEGNMRLNTTLEYFLQKFDSTLIINQRRDIVNGELLQKKYPGRVFFCRYVSESGTNDPFRWGSGDDHRIVFAERSKAIRTIIGEFERGLMRLYRKSDNDGWRDYASHWGHIYEIAEIDKSGIERFIWNRFDCDDYVNATISWRAGATRFGQRGGVFMPPPEIPTDAPISYIVNPDYTVDMNPDDLFGRDIYNARLMVAAALKNPNEPPFWAEEYEEDD